MSKACIAAPLSFKRFDVLRLGGRNKKETTNKASHSHPPLLMSNFEAGAMLDKSMRCLQVTTGVAMKKGSASLLGSAFKYMIRFTCWAQRVLFLYMLSRDHDSCLSAQNVRVPHQK